MNKKTKDKIDNMSQLKMAQAVRFASVGDPLFQGEAGAYFGKVFTKKGGMTTAVSKEIGWEKK